MSHSSGAGLGGAGLGGAGLGGAGLGGLGGAGPAGPPGGVYHDYVLYARFMLLNNFSS